MGGRRPDLFRQGMITEGHWHLTSSDVQPSSGSLVFLGIVSAIIFLVGSLLWWSEWHFLRSCVAGTASLTSNPAKQRGFTARYSSAPDNYFFTYEFWVKGARYEGEGTMLSRPDKQVTVFYNPKNPKNNTVEDPDTWLGRTVTEVGSLFCIFFWPSWLLRRYQRRPPSP